MSVKIRVDRVNTIETVDPATAKEWLRRNTINRPLSERYSRTVAADILGGRYVYNGESIKWSRDRVLLDGQHRLRAIVIAGRPVETAVAWGLDPSVFTSIDIGRKRNGSDTLALMGVKNATTVSSAVAMVHSYLTGNIWLTGWHSPANEIVKFMYREHEEISDSVTWDHKMRQLTQYASVAVGAHFLFSRVDYGSADRFMGDLVVGAQLEKNDPVLHLRNRLMQEKSKRTNTRSISRGYVAALYFKAWNARERGRKVRALKVYPGEEYPEIDGFPGHMLMRKVVKVPTA